MKNGLVNKLFFSGILAICLSCSVRRDSSESNHYRNNESRKIKKIESTSDIGITLSETLKNKRKDYKIYHRVFDLDRKPDQEGKYPVKSETLLVGKENQKEETTEQTQKIFEKNMVDSLDISNRQQTDSRKKTIQEMDVGSKPLWWWLVGVVSVLVGMIILWWKYGKKNKTK